MRPDSTADTSTPDTAGPGGQPHQGHPGQPHQGRLGHWLCLYLPLVVWLGVVAVNSTDLASAAHTDELLLRLVRVLFPEQAEADSRSLEAASWALRRTAHVVEYGILAILLARVVRARVPGVRRSAGRELLWKISIVVVPGSLLVAALDELHQSLVASRSGALADVAFDLTGILLGVLVMWLVWRREPQPPGSASPTRRVPISY